MLWPLSYTPVNWNCPAESNRAVRVHNPTPYHQIGLGSLNAGWRCRPVSSRLMAVLQTAAFPFRHCTAARFLVGSGRNRTSCPKGPRLQRGDGTSLSLWHFPYLVAAPGLTWCEGFQLLRVLPVLPRSADMADA